MPNLLLIEFLANSPEQGFGYALSHDDLLTGDVYTEVQNLVQHADNSVMQIHLLKRQILLAGAAAHIVLFPGPRKWERIRSIFLKGLPWLTHPATKAYMALIAEDRPESAGHVAFINNSITRCANEGVEQFVKEEDLKLLLTRLNEARGSLRVPLLQQALLLMQSMQPKQLAGLRLSWADLQLTLESELKQLSANVGNQSLEDPLQALNQALQLYTREVYPLKWAETQYLLGITYERRLLGVEADNMEQAIQAFELALQVYTREAHPLKWATIQNYLGCTCRGRLRGNKADNMEQAIQALELALQVSTREQYAEEWATAQTNLGNAYRERLRGNRADNVEQAIQAYKLALQVYTREAHAQQWATIQHNLGGAYSERLRGEEADNMEQSIQAYELALQVSTREQYAEEWATTQNPKPAFAFKGSIRGEEWAETQSNLGISFKRRLRGNKADNVEQAIQAFELALQVYTREAHARKWAEVQHNLGGAYSERLRGEKADNMERAIQAYELALLVRSYEHYAEEWAMTQTNLGNAYRERLRGNRADNVEQAIQAYELALQVYTRESNPERWGMSQLFLGNAYRERLRGNRADNVKQAIRAIQLALLVFVPEQFAKAYRDANYTLGHLLYDEGRWSEARDAYECAHNGLELMRVETVREESRRQLARENTVLYEQLIHCCLHLGDVESAATYALLSKSRSLTELLTGDKQSLDQLLERDSALAVEWEPIQALRNELDNLLAVLRLPTREGEGMYAEEQQEQMLNRVSFLRKEINQRSDTLLFRFPALAAVKPLPSLSIAEVQALSAELGSVPLVEYIQHSGGWGAFVISPTAVDYALLPENLNALLVDDLKAILEDNFWIQNDLLVDQSAVLARMHTALIAPLEPHLPASGPLVLAPTSILHLVPFQALLNERGTYLSETYAMSIVPSLATLHVLHQQRLRRPPDELAAGRQILLSVGYSDQDGEYLPNVLPEARAIARHFQKTVQLLEEDATPERVFAAVAKQPFDVVHVNCHGSFHYDSPLDSGLLLAQNNWLTVNDIRLRLRLQGQPLVTLSACQTGQTRPEQGDESNSLSWAFLAAGASAVVSSQWSVPDEATRELFEAFYLLRRPARLSDAEALQQAMQQLRQTAGYRYQPFYWAAFQVLGLPICT